MSLGEFSMLLTCIQTQVTHLMQITRVEADTWFSIEWSGSAPEGGGSWEPSGGGGSGVYHCINIITISVSVKNNGI